MSAETVIFEDQAGKLVREGDGYCVEWPNDGGSYSIPPGHTRLLSWLCAALERAVGERVKAERDFNAAREAHDMAVAELVAAREEAKRWRRMDSERMVRAMEESARAAPAPDAGQGEDESPGDVIAAYADGTVVLDDGISTHNFARACEFLARSAPPAPAAEYFLHGCFTALEKAVRARDEWWGRTIPPETSALSRAQPAGQGEAWYQRAADAIRLVAYRRSTTPFTILLEEGKMLLHDDADVRKLGHAIFESQGGPRG